MLSKAQEIEINEKVLKVAREFINTGYSIEEVSNVTGISKSSVQRYLNDEKRIVNLLGHDSYNKIQEMLKVNKQEGLSKGGSISTTNNTPIRDENGKFAGNVKK